MRAALGVVGALAACGGPPAPSLPWNEPAANQARREPVEDDEPDDGVQVTSTRGRTDPEAVNAGLAPRRAELTGCYLHNVGKRRWLGGKLIVHWDIAADGAITRVLLAESDVGAWPIEKCVLAVARATTFGKPIGGPAELTLPLEFAAPAPADVWGLEPSVRAVGGHLVKLEACAGQGAVPGEVAITLYVGPQGRVQSVGFASATAPLDDAWASCAERVALAWQLPDPKGQVTKLAVRYRPR
jgi:hypothetical protein